VPAIVSDPSSYSKNRAAATAPKTPAGLPKFSDAALAVWDAVEDVALPLDVLE